ncbi:MAG TPA: DNA polymerase III subunit chi [Burkholderiaceae bacterium]|nr:DNA polymerase III subunit chi [Burkholderiaceae bacterium]
MAHVDFAFGAPNRLRMACDVARKHYLAGHRLLVYCRDETVLARFDRLLWGFEPTAFVPHVRTGDPLEADTPVVLASSLPLPGATPESTVGAPGDDAPWLLNLDPEVPPRVEQFARVLEIVSSHDADKQAARQRWRHYESSGHTLRAFDVSPPPESDTPP